MRQPVTDLIDLPEEELAVVKQRFLADGLLLERQNLPPTATQFFETVTVTNVVIKFCLFFSLGLYCLINLAAIIFAIVKDTLANPFNNLIGLLAICLIVYAIFSNINTNRRKKENALWLANQRFIFNFTDGVTTNLFYALPVACLQKITGIIYGTKKGQVMGSVTFTFAVQGYPVQHQIRYTNLSLIARTLSDQLPAGVAGLSVDVVTRRAMLKNNLTAFATLVAGVLLLAIPYALHYYSVALTAAAIILLLTAVLVVLASSVKLCHLGAGLVISGVFIIMGFCVPLLTVEISSMTLLDFLASNSEILLPTIFGIIGLCLYWYSIVSMINKLKYKLSHKTEVGGK